MARYGTFMVQTVSVPGVFSSALGDFGYIFRSPDMEQIEEIVRFIQEAPNKEYRCISKNTTGTAPPRPGYDRQGLRTLGTAVYCFPLFPGTLF